jgi:hypothetical protein
LAVPTFLVTHGWLFSLDIFIIMYILKCGPHFVALFPQLRLWINYDKKVVWLHFGPHFSQTHLVTLPSSSEYGPRQALDWREEKLQTFFARQPEKGFRSLTLKTGRKNALPAAGWILFENVLPSENADKNFGPKNLNFKSFYIRPTNSPS